LEATLRGGTATPIGRLRVDSLITIARWVIAPRLHDFQARYPRIQLRLSSSDRISNLLEDGIDCTIRGGALKDSSMIARHLCDIQMGLYASPEYLASIGGVDSP
ncbi:LysR family transcriptional regulator, partial [Pseudomonas aeruginosa]|nr:LysR family transcriptional regulator [Pseudomonas aeruginosa]